MRQSARTRTRTNIAQKGRDTKHTRPPVFRRIAAAAALFAVRARVLHKTCVEFYIIACTQRVRNVDGDDIDDAVSDGAQRVNCCRCGAHAHAFAIKKSCAVSSGVCEWKFAFFAVGCANGAIVI